MKNIESQIADTKTVRKNLDEVLQFLKSKSDTQREVLTSEDSPRGSRERSIAVTKIQEAIMWLGMDLKAINEENPGSAPNPYPESYNPASSKIEPTSEGLKL